VTNVRETLVDTFDDSMAGPDYPGLLFARGALAFVGLLVAGLVAVVGRESVAGQALGVLVVAVVVATPLFLLWRFLVVRRRVKETGSPFSNRELL